MATGSTAWSAEGMKTRLRVDKPLQACTLLRPGRYVRKTQLGISGEGRTMRTRDRVLRAAFVSVALGLAWSIRGDYGGSLGVGLAMGLPTAALAMGFAYVSGQRTMFKWMPLLGAVAALAFLVPVSDYHPLHAYASNKTFVNYSYGLFMLIVQGGGWACFSCCLIGLMLEKNPLRASEWASAVATVFVSAFLFYYVVVVLIGFHLTFGAWRTDRVIGITGGVIGLFVWLILNKKHYGFKAAFIGFIAFGLGMAVGRFLANVRDYTSFTIGGWNVLQGLFGRFGNIMEVFVGLVGGFIFTYGMLGKRAPDFPEDKHYKLLSVYSILFLLAGIPILHRVLNMDGSIIDRDTGNTKMQKWEALFREHGHADAPALAESIPATISLVCAIAIVAALVWLFLHFRNKHRFAAFPVLCVLGAMVVIQNLDYQYLYYPIGVVSWKLFLFPGMFLFMLLYAIFVKTPEVTEPDEVAEHVNWRRWLVGAFVVYAVMVVLSGPVNGARGDEIKPDQMRFPAGGVTPKEWGYRPPAPTGE